MLWSASVPLTLRSVGSKLFQDLWTPYVHQTDQCTLEGSSAKVRVPCPKPEQRGWAAPGSGRALQELEMVPETICHGHVGMLSVLGVSHRETQGKTSFSPTAAFHSCLMMHDGPQERWEHEGIRWDCFMKMFDLITVGSLHLKNCVFWISPRAILPCRNARINTHVMKVQLRQGSSSHCYLAVLWN